MNKIGNMISKYRRENNITQKELAEKLGVSNTAISKWECGNNLPDITMLKPLSEVLQVDILTLLDIQSEIVVEQNNKSIFKQKYLIPISIIIIILSLIISISSIIYSKHKIDNLPEPVNVYTIYSEDERLDIDGYVIASSDKVITFVNNIVYNDENIGTKYAIKIKTLDIKIMTDNTILYSHHFELDNKEELNEILSNVENEKSELLYDNENKKINETNNAYLVIKYNDYDDSPIEFSMPLEFSNTF